MSTDEKRSADTAAAPGLMLNALPDDPNYPPTAGPAEGFECDTCGCWCGGCGCADAEERAGEDGTELIHVPAHCCECGRTGLDAEYRCECA